MIPNRTTDGTHFGAAWNQAREALRSHEPLQAPGLRTSHTVHGVIREPEEPPRPYGEVEPVPATGVIKVATLISVAAETLSVRLQDGTTVTVYKPFALRASTNDGLGFNYTYSGGQERDASSGGTFIESQLILPRYLVGGLLWITQPDYAYATQPTAGNTWLDLNVDGRAWARKYV